jgi:hypothetical protein
VSITPAAGPLNPGQIEHIRRSSTLPQGADLSPSQAFSVKVHGDSVVLTETATGDERAIPVRGMRLLDATVSDRGDVAVLGSTGDGQGQHVGRLEADGTFRLAEHAPGLASPELSADGSRLTWLSVREVREAFPDGPRTVAQLDHASHDSQFLDDGRILLRGSIDPWALRSGVPRYSVVGPDGSATTVQDVDAAEQFGLPVRSNLEKVYRRFAPGASSEQIQELVDTFGYRAPLSGVHSPSGEDGLFWISRGDSIQPFGLYRVRSGKGSPQAGLGPTDTARVGDGTILLAAFPPGERRAAVAFEGPEGWVAVSDFEGKSRLIQGLASADVDSNPLAWSPDGRLLALQIREGNRTGVQVYDIESDTLHPLVPEGRIQGWNGLNLEVVVDGSVQTLLPDSVDAQQLRDHVLGGRPQDAWTIQAGDGVVRIGGISLPVRSDALEAPPGHP